MYDIVNKNLDKVTNPKGEEKSSMYWPSGDTSNINNFLAAELVSLSHIKQTNNNY